MKPIRTSVLVGALFVSALAAQTRTAPRLSNDQTIDRSQLPEALRNVRLDHLSSGALLRLDHEGDLVESSAAWSSRTQSGRQAESPAAAVALDRRVGSNIRLGEDPPALPTGLRAQAEPHIARSQANPDLVLATFQEGRRADGGAADCGYGSTHDGGLTWTRALIPGLTTTSGGAYSRATDPVAAIGLNGAAYLNTIGATNTTFTTGAVVVNRSTDSGATFGAPVVVYQSPNSSFFPDKNWMAVNTFAGTPTAGRVVVTFSLFTSANSNGAPIVRAFSDNQGATWSSSAQVAPSTPDTQGSQPVFLADGKLAIVYWNFNHTESFADDFMQVVTSDDGGNTFGAPKYVTKVDHYAEPTIRSGGFLPAATADRVGNLYVVYQALFNGSPKILFVKSADAGSTWTTPVPISDNPNGVGVFNAAVAASPNGQTLTVAFYDHRDNPGSNTLVDMYLAQSFDGGATWQPNIRLTPVSTDARLAPLTGSGYMLGDYLGVAEPTTPDVPAIPVWIDTRTGNPDPFVARVGVAPALDFRSWQAARLSLGQINDPQLGGEPGDADTDGEDNLSEFRSGTDPADPLSVFRSARQLNISTRGLVKKDDNVLIGGFIITGNEPKQVIVRALGPSLTSKGIAGALDNPTLDLRGANGSSIAFNDDWRINDGAAIEATGLPPSDDREAAIVRTLAPGSYTAIVRGKNDTAGVALVETYDLAGTNSARLANISSRGLVQTGDNVIIGGIIIGAGGGSDSSGTAHVVLRALGPSLAQFGITDWLSDPELQVVDANATTIIANDDWQQTQAAELQASGIAPSDSHEAAAIVVLAKGGYTVVVRGKNSALGTALVEAYNLP